MKKRFLGLSLLVFVALALPIVANAATSGYCGNSLTWNLDDNDLPECVSKSIPTRIMQEVYGYRPNGQKPRSDPRVCHSG